jgi:hypothetical protein
MELVTLCSLDLVESTEKLGEELNFVSKKDGFLDLAKDTIRYWEGKLFGEPSGDGFEFLFRTSTYDRIGIYNHQVRALYCCISILHQLPYYNRLYKNIASACGDIKIRIAIGLIHIFNDNDNINSNDKLPEISELEISRLVKSQKNIARPNTVAISDDIRLHLTDIAKSDIPLVELPGFRPKHYLYYPDLVDWRHKNYDKCKRIINDNLINPGFTELCIVPNFKDSSDSLGISRSHLITQETSKIFRRKLSEMKNKEVVKIGVVGGSLVRDVINMLEHTITNFNKITNSKLIFLSTNSAAQRDRYQYSANYLTTRISDFYHYSRHLVQINQGTNSLLPVTDELLNELNIIIGSVGARDGWLFEQLSKDKSIKQEVLDKIIGDLFLVPITTTGGSLDSNIFNKIKKTYNIYPEFDSIQKIPADCKIILPIHSQPIFDTQNGQTTNSKSDIAKTVLKSGRINDCIISESVALELLNNLKTSVCTNNNEEQLNTKNLKVKYTDLEGAVCNIDSLGGNTKKQVKLIGNIDLFDFTSTKHINSISKVNNEIIISDPIVPTNFFNTEAEYYPVLFLHEIEYFKVLRNVRKPGYWSTTTVREAIDSIFELNKKQIRILDMGCGSGVIGRVYKQVCNWLSYDLSSRRLRWPGRRAKQIPS